MNKNLKKEIMTQIRDDKITIKSRWIFLAKKIGLRSGLALTIIFLIFFINAFFFYIKANGFLLSLHFGSSVWQKLLHALPYDLMLLIIIFLVLLNYIIKRFDFSYKQHLVVVFLIFILGITLFATLLFATDFNMLLKNDLKTSNFRIPFISDFYIHRCGR